MRKAMRSRCGSILPHMMSLMLELCPRRMSCTYLIELQIEEAALAGSCLSSRSPAQTSTLDRSPSLSSLHVLSIDPKHCY